MNILCLSGKNLNISSNSSAMFILLYRNTDDGVFDNFPKISNHFPKISKDSPKLA